MSRHICLWGTELDEHYLGSPAELIIVHTHYWGAGATYMLLRTADSKQRLLSFSSPATCGDVSLVGWDSS